MIGVIVALVVSVVGWSAACVACCFAGKGLCSLFGKMPSVCKVTRVIIIIGVQGDQRSL